MERSRRIIGYCSSQRELPGWIPGKDVCVLWLPLDNSQDEIDYSIFHCVIFDFISFRTGYQKTVLQRIEQLLKRQDPITIWVRLEHQKEERMLLALIKHHPVKYYRITKWGASFLVVEE